MQTIRLTRGEWSFDENDRLGPAGAFGEVFRGSGENGPVAVKRLMLTAGAAEFRELHIGEVLAKRDLNHVVPVFDWGQDADSDRYFVVMQICERSLEDAISPSAPFETPQLCQTVLDILAGLIEVSDIVHRDLKPGNILYFDGRWCLADFGIAKFVEDATSLKTLRQYRTPLFAAPEQWRDERATNATDVYALGCIVHALLTGFSPFLGSDDEVREAHLHAAAPPLPHVDAKLVAFVGQMLRKSPEARPPLARCAEVFADIAKGSSRRVHNALEEAAAWVAAKAASDDAANKAAQNRVRAREGLIEEATSELSAIKFRLLDRIRQTAAELTSIADDKLRFGLGTLAFGKIVRMAGTHDGKPNRRHSGWDVCAFSGLEIERDQVSPGSRPHLIGGRKVQVTMMDPPYKWGATLAFASMPEDETYRWREVSFSRTNANFGPANEPFWFPATSDEFDTALSKAPHAFSVAFGPKAIDGEDEQDFQHRWLFLLGKAAIGDLRRPPSMPILSDYFDET